MYLNRTDICGCESFGRLFAATKGVMTSIWLVSLRDLFHDLTNTSMRARP